MERITDDFIIGKSEAPNLSKWALLPPSSVRLVVPLPLFRLYGGCKQPRLAVGDSIRSIITFV